MRKGAYLINVARGPIVDREPLLAALRSGKLAGAGLDVTDPEPLPDGDPFWSLPNVIITPTTPASPTAAPGGSSSSPGRTSAASRPGNGS